MDEILGLLFDLIPREVRDRKVIDADRKVLAGA